MPKDFASQSYKKKQKKVKVTFLNIIFFCACVALVISGIFFVTKKQNKNLQVVENSQEITDVKKTNTQEKKEIEVVHNRPRFEFYTMLPDMNDKQNIKQTYVNEKGNFILVIAKFKYEQKAQQLQKELIAKGYHAKINIEKLELTNVMYRVELGIYPDTSSAIKAQEQLLKDKYTSKLLKQIQ